MYHYRTAEEVTIVVGEHDHSLPDSVNPSRSRYQVGTIFMHEQYDDATFDNDIGIITGFV